MSEKGYVRIYMVDFRELVKAGVHFGHQTSRWCPKMGPYIWGFKNKVHLIDVSKTAFQLEKSAQFLKQIAAEGKTILWIGTKKAAQNIIYSTATTLDMPYVNHRWIGGTLSNYVQVKKAVTKLLHYEDILAKAEKDAYYTKKELNVFQKVAGRLKRSIGGILNLTWPVGAIVIVDIGKEQSALNEAVKMGVPVVGIVDTNSDPSLVDYVIPANDDAPRSIKILIDYLVQAVQQGKEEAAVTAQKEQEAKKSAEQEKKAAKATTAKAKETKVKPEKAEPKKEVAVAKTKKIKKTVAPKKAETSKAETSSVKSSKDTSCGCFTTSALTRKKIDREILAYI